MIPNTSCVRTECTFPCVGSGRSNDSREPWATMISCCFFPLKAPRIACVMADGCSTVSEYRNMFELPDMVKKGMPRGAQREFEGSGGRL